ncbi:MAG TPA: helix-turn-helix transcriptional regulator [Acidimicrobiales bacterium]|nr:helix-turn-helix transcriptional regulator [Acidimicrobiales bacterium]
MDKDAALGEKVAFYRRRRGLSQVEFAALVGRSESWVSQVERGVRTVDRMSVLAQVADVLNVPVADLARERAVPEPSPAGHYVDELRMALSGHPALGVLLAGPNADKLVLEVEQLQEKVSAAWPMAHASRYGELGPVLASLIPELEEAARRSPARKTRAVKKLLAEVYQAASAMLAKLDEPEAAWVAADRALLAGEQAGDPLLAAAGQYRMAQAFLSSGRLEQAREVARRGVEALGAPVVSNDPQRVSLWGAMQLVLATVSAREGDRRAARSHLGEARRAGEALGGDRNDFDTEFGPTNVAVHEVGVAVELGDAGEALDTAATVDASALSAERRARFLIDLALAYSQRRRGAEALRALEEAEALTPEQIHDHHVVRQIVTDLLQGEGRRPHPELQAFARRIGALP